MADQSTIRPAPSIHYLHLTWGKSACKHVTRAELVSVLSTSASLAVQALRFDESSTGRKQGAFVTLADPVTEDRSNGIVQLRTRQKVYFKPCATVDPERLAALASCIEDVALTADVHVPGLVVRGGFVTADEERALLAAIDAREWTTTISKNGRRVQHYGYAFDYSKSEVSRVPIAPLPAFCKPLLARLRESGVLPHAPDQLTVNEYRPGQGIAPHVDSPRSFKDGICSLALGSDAVFSLRIDGADPEEQGCKKDVLQHRRTLVVLCGDARYTWAHTIAPRKSDVVGALLRPRTRRVSLTFRSVLFPNTRPFSPRGDAYWEKVGRPRFVAAPMVGYSDKAFRLSVRRHGVQLAFSPMIHSAVLLATSNDAGSLLSLPPPTPHETEDATGYSSPGALARDLSPTGGDRPLVAQCCATTVDEFVKACKRIASHGVDAVDLNLGCPQKTARLRGYGAFLTDKPRLVREMIEAAVAALEGTGCAVTAKIRVCETVQETVAFAQMLEAAGCASVTVHGRFRAQRHHTGAIRVDTLKAVVEACRVPIIVNGGVRSRAEAEELLSATGAAAAMAATALLDDRELFSPVEQQEEKGHGGLPWRDLEGYLRCADVTPPASMRFVTHHVLRLLGGQWGALLKLHPDLYSLLARKQKDVTTLEQVKQILHLLAHRHGVPASWMPSGAPRLTLRAICDGGKGGGDKKE